MFLFSFLYKFCPVSFAGITWVLVYRTEKYKRLKAEVEKQSKKRKCRRGDSQDPTVPLQTVHY